MLTRTDILTMSFEELEQTFKDYFCFNFYKKPVGAEGYINKMSRQKELDNYFEFKRNRKKLIEEQKMIMQAMKQFCRDHPRFTKQFTKDTTYKHIKDFYYMHLYGKSEEEIKTMCLKKEVR